MVDPRFRSPCRSFEQSNGFWALCRCDFSRTESIDLANEFAPTHQAINGATPSTCGVAVTLNGRKRGGAADDGARWSELDLPLSRRPRARPFLLVLLLIWAWSATPVLAHRLQVFAVANGALIEGSAYFAGGAPASGVDVRVEDASGRVLAELTPAADGRFSYRAAAPADHVVVVRSADGHRAEWTVRAAEFAPAFSVAPSDEPPTALSFGMDAAYPAPPDGAQPTPLPQAPRETIPSRENVNTAALGQPNIDPALTAALELAVARQLRPLREELAAARATASMRDVLGGIGYILGLAGIALWWRARGSGARTDTGSANDADDETEAGIGTGSNSGRSR